jgi:hypothetical protein
MKKIIILLTVLTITGCATSEPKMYDLLHREGAKNLVYKSITIEDYKGEDYIALHETTTSKKRSKNKAKRFEKIER